MLNLDLVWCGLEWLCTVHLKRMRLCIVHMKRRRLWSACMLGDWVFLVFASLILHLFVWFCTSIWFGIAVHMRRIRLWHMYAFWMIVFSFLLLWFCVCLFGSTHPYGLVLQCIWGGWGCEAHLCILFLLVFNFFLFLSVCLFAGLFDSRHPLGTYAKAVAMKRMRLWSALGRKLGSRKACTAWAFNRLEKKSRE